MEDITGMEVKGYLLKERIGAGGFGAVYRAEQSTVGRDVAVKVILPGLASRPEFIRRFENEAQLVARLEHLHITPLYDYWRDPDGAYLVMRYLRGGSLAGALAGEPYSLEQSADLLDQIASALAAAHRGRVIHRDIKPSNILLDEDGNAYLTDFGIAKDLELRFDSDTETGAVLGSPDYLAPEQARSDPVTPQTDIYSLGIVLYEMLAGEHPFPGLSGVERLFKHLNDPVPRLTNLDTEIIDPVNAVVQKATAKDPRARYADALAFATAFREAARLGASREVGSLVELLTPREQEVLRLILDGKSNREIAEELIVELVTVKWYVKQIYKKLNVRSRVQAIVKARELDLVVRAPEGQTSGSVLLPEPENPYKGLRPFQAADAADFFGRERLVKKLIGRLVEKKSAARFLAVVGPSGSGKSSLVRAGLIPALWRGELPKSENWYIVDMIPGSHPFEELEVALTRVAAQPVGRLKDHLEGDARGLLRASQLVLPDDGSELLVVIDQFEEVFTLVEAEETRVRFLDLLHTAVMDPRSRVRVVVTLRADFYDRPLRYAEFGRLVRDRVETVLPLSAEELERAIVRPATAEGVQFEEGLPATIIQAIHYQPGALPLLQYALTELFEVREGRTLTHKGYQQIGGVVGALASRAEGLYGEQNETGREALRQMFLRLVTLGEGVEDTRRRVPRAELLAVAAEPERMDELIDTLVGYRLMSLDVDPGTRAPTVEVAHEAILREWERLRGWLNDGRADIRMGRQLSAAAAEWAGAREDESYLLRGARLEGLEAWSRGTELALTGEEREFLELSLAARDREVEAELRRNEREELLQRRSQRVVQALAVVFLVAAVVSGWLAVRANAAEEEALRQAAIGLGAQAIAELDSDTPDRGVLLALEAIENYPYAPQIERALAQTVYSTIPYVDLVGSGRLDTSGTINSVSFSPDGNHIAVSASENDGVVWDVRSLQPRGFGNFYQEQDQRIFHADITWNPEGNRFAAVTAAFEDVRRSPGLIRIWDSVTGNLVSEWLGHEGESIWGVDWSRDGSRFATAGADNLVKIWDAQTWEEIAVLSGHLDEVRSISWSPGDLMLASASIDHSLRIWAVGSWETIQTFSGHLDTVNSVDWSPNGRRFVSGGEDGLVIIWDMELGGIFKTLSGHTQGVKDVAWSPDGLRIASASEDGSTIIWDVPTGTIATVLKGNARSVDWSPDGDQLVVGYGITGLRLWDLSNRQFRLVGHEAGALTAGIWTPDGSSIITAGFDGTARVWDARSGESKLIYRGHVSETGLLAIDINISPDSNWAASVGGDNHVRFWNIATGEDRYSFPYFGGNVFSPDGTKWLIFNESQATILDWESGETLVEFDPGLEGFCALVRLSWSSDGKRIATPCSTQAHVDIWDAETGNHLKKLITEDTLITPTDWSPDGSWLLTAGDRGIVYLWDASSLELNFEFKGHTSTVWDAAWSPDGSLIASTEETGSVRIWNPLTGQEVNRYSVGFSPLDVNWSPDGNYLITAGIGSDVPDIHRVWQSTEELIAYAKECCVFRELTPEERQQFGLPPAEKRETGLAPGDFYWAVSLALGGVWVTIVVVRRKGTAMFRTQG